MAKNFYLPKNDQDKVTWLHNFNKKLTVHGTTVGILPDEMNSVANDAKEFDILVNFVTSGTSAKEQVVSYKNLLRDGPLGSPLGDFPSFPSVSVPDPLVLPGIFPRIRALVQRIKNHPNYTEAIGNDLDIIGAEETPPIAPSLLKPTLKLFYTSGHVEIQWTKPSNVSGIMLQVIRGDEQWQFLAVDTVPNYVDMTPITRLALWKYRGTYVSDDVQVGQWSDTVQIALGQDATG